MDHEINLTDKLDVTEHLVLGKLKLFLFIGGEDTSSIEGWKSVRKISHKLEIESMQKKRHTANRSLNSPEKKH